LCGITGFTHKNWSPDAERIHRATATLIHRGPDEQGVHSSATCSLGATRLKIIDLEGGDQPITSGDTTIVFNGEVYNFRELRAELETLGHRFQSHSDTETVLHTFLEWDTAAFARLRGMFAFALWTESTRRLVLVRDRMGIKPLFVARRGSDIFFGSELKSLFVHPEIERRISLDALDCYLALNYVPAPWSMVAGVEKLTPGTWLEWRDGRVRTEAYWRLPRTTPNPRRMEDAVEELDELLRQSIREHLLSDVPLGMWLSGGVDSSTILHYAATQSSSRLKTFSISFHGRSFDESRYTRAVAEHFDTDHEELDLNPQEKLRGAIEEFAYFSDEPMADAGALPVWFLSRLSKRKVTVTLSGEGADELFGGYLTYRANRYAALARRLPRPMLRAALAAAHQLPVSDDKIGFEYMLKRLLEGSLMSPERAHVYWNGTFSDAEKAKLTVRPLPAALAGLLSNSESKYAGDDLAQYLWFDQNYYLGDDILVKSDRMSMAHSLEVRPAFLDHRIVEFAATLPASLKIRGANQKVILKELMRGKLPAAVLTRKKIGLDIPAHDWLRGPLRAFMKEVLSDGLAHYGDLFRRKEIEDLMQRHLDRRANVGYHLWGLMILFLWMKKWNIGIGSSASESAIGDRMSAIRNQHVDTTVSG
jgi:asparagine synthase (glutamine-hydrolysing)